MVKMAIVKNDAAPPAEAIAEPVSEFTNPPKHFKKKVQKDAWTDLTTKADAAMRTAENYFAFEMAATLLAKFRAGAPMNATEGKELKKLLISLGLAKPDDDGQKKKPKKNDHYFA